MLPPLQDGPQARAVLTGRPAVSARERHVCGALLALLITGILAAAAAHALLDNPQLMGDGLDNLVSAVALEEAVGADGGAWRRWLEVSRHRPFIPSVVYLPGAALLHDKVLAIRLTDGLFFALCLLLIYQLGAALWRPAAGLLAAFLFATFPVAWTWTIHGNADPILWLVLLLLFRATLAVNLTKPGSAIALGLAVGLCMGTRLLALVYLVGPALWLLIFHVRSKRSVLNLALAAACALAVCGWWYLAQFDAVLTNLTHSVDRPDFPVGFPTITEEGLLAFLWLGVPSAAAAVLVLVRGLIPRRVVWLAALWVAIPALQFSFIWSGWARYPIALIPPCVLILAIAVCWLAWRLGSGGRWLLLGAAALAGGLPMMVSWGEWSAFFYPVPLPVAARQDGMARALATVPPGEMVAVHHFAIEPAFAWGLLHVGPDQGYRRLYNQLPEHNRIMARPGGAKHLLLVCPTDSPEAVDAPTEEKRGAWFQRRLAPLGPSLVARSENSDGVGFELYRLDRPVNAAGATGDRPFFIYKPITRAAAQ